MRRFKGECAHFSFNKCPIYNDDGASAKLSTNSHETDFSAARSKLYRTSITPLVSTYTPHGKAAQMYSTRMFSGDIISVGCEVKNPNSLLEIVFRRYSGWCKWQQVEIHEGTVLWDGAHAPVLFSEERPLKVQPLLPRRSTVPYSIVHFLSSL
jgi:hypothetical protein